MTDEKLEFSAQDLGRFVKWMADNIELDLLDELEVWLSLHSNGPEFERVKQSANDGYFET